MSIAGYIVVTERGALWEENRKSASDERGVLYHANRVTIFATRARANAAIARSERYEKAQSLTWNEAYWIQPVEMHDADRDRRG